MFRAELCPSGSNGFIGSARIDELNLDQHAFEQKLDGSDPWSEACTGRSYGR